MNNYLSKATVVLFEKLIYLCCKPLQMNFTEFHKDLTREFNLPHNTSKKIVAYLMKRMRHNLLFGTEITLRNIGTLVLKVRQPKPFLNLQTKVMQMSVRKYVLDIRVTHGMADALKKKTVYGYALSQSEKKDKK